MTTRILISAALAVLALTGCANADGYYGGHQQGPYYAEDPYYGYPYNNGNDNGRYFRPERNVTCDQERHVCYDQYGLSYTATKQYLGERYANHAVKIYGNQILFFSPKRGVVCDRRAETCSDSDGVDRKWTKRVFDSESYQYSQYPGYGYSQYPGYGYSQYPEQHMGGVDRHWTGPNGECPPKGCADK